jgi:hypothetical protein
MVAQKTQNLSSSKGFYLVARLKRKRKLETLAKALLLGGYFCKRVCFTYTSKPGVTMTRRESWDYAKSPAKAPAFISIAQAKGEKPTGAGKAEPVE